MQDKILLKARELGKKLQKLKLTCATAESCTGGGIAYWITSVSGSSIWFDRGFVTYTNTAKIDLLGVNPKTLEKYGAVSEETAIEMAKGALSNSKADIAVATTGIAGPDGGTAEKPVGTVWLAYAVRGGKSFAHKYVLDGDRKSIREQTIDYALGVTLNSCGDLAS